MSTRRSLEAELRELERTDPKVRAAKEKFDAVAKSIVEKKIPEEDVRDEDLRVGDLVKIIGTWRRIVEIRPYRGPHDFVVGIAETVPPGGFSLCRGSWTTRAKR